MTVSADVHRHGRGCYWDHLRCGWVCASTRTAPEAEARPEVPAPVPERAPALEPLTVTR
jgi:hypothetical protein